ncbi:MAG: hypothetical protein AAGF15_11795 [Pseudomonadota bacterium]
MQQKCRAIGQTMDLMIGLARTSGPLTYKMTSAVLNYVLRNELARCVALDSALKKIDRAQLGYAAANAGSATAGRYAGGLFTLYASTGGRFGSRVRTGPVKYGYIASNVLLASTGSIVRLAIKTRGIGVSAADVAIVLLTGRAEAAFSNEIWREIFLGVQRCKNLRTDAQDEIAFNQLFAEIDKFTSEVKLAGRE